MTAQNAHQPCLLLVEGEGDRQFLSMLLTYLNLRREMQVVAYYGKNNLCNVLNSLRRTFQCGTVKSLGITRDADQQGKEPSLQSLRGALYRAGLTRSEKNITPIYSHLQISTHIICDSSGRGRLEEMILEAIRYQPLMAYVDNEVEHLRRLMAVDEGKTRLGIFMGCHSNLDAAIQQRCFNFAHPVYDPLKHFLRAL